MKHLLSPKLALIAALGMIAVSPLSAATIDIASTQVGGFFEDGMTDNSVGFQNYYVGYSTLASIAVRRNFFYFDLTTYTTPIVSAEFALTLPFSGLYFGGDGMGGFEVEDYILSGTPFASAVVLDTLIDPASAMMVWDTFGDPAEIIGGTGFDSMSPPGG